MSLIAQQAAHYNLNLDDMVNDYTIDNESQFASAASRPQAFNSFGE